MPDFGRWTSNGGDPSLNEINRTDRFIEALSLERPVYSTDPGEAELAYLLAGWRDDARHGSMAGIATPRDAVAALNRGTARGRPRLPLALVGSVAAAVLCLGGFGAVVYGSSPGDALYGVRGMFFGEQQVKHDVQVELASTELAQVQQLIDQGQWQAAQEKLQTITTTVATVGDAQQKQDLVNQWQQLSVKVENRDPNATVPPDAPPVVLPEVTATSVPTPPSESPGSSTSATETLSPSSSTPPSETTSGSSETSSPAPTSSSSEPTATSAPSNTSTSATSTPPLATSTNPPAELPATGTSTPAPPPSSPVHTTTTILPTVPTAAPSSAPPVVTVPTVAEPQPEAGGGEAPAAREPAGGGRQQQQAPPAPVIELPLLPGLTGGGQR